VWLLWEPIMAVFGWLGDFLSPLIDWIKDLSKAFGGWGNMILFVLGPIGWLILALEWVMGLFDWLFGAGDDSENTFSLGWITDGITWLTDWVYGWLDMLPGWFKWLLGLDGAEVPEDAGPEEQDGVQSAVALVEGTEEGAASSAEEQPDWWKSMWGIEGAEEIAESASKEFEDAGVEAGSSLSDIIASETGEQNRVAEEDQTNAFGMLMDQGDSGIMGMIFDIGSLFGSFMLEGMTGGMFSIASAFPLSSIMGTMFGPFASILGSPAGEQAKEPSFAGVNVSEVDYNVDAEISGDDIAGPIVKALAIQTRSLQTAISNSASKDLDLDLSELKDIAGFN